MNKGSVAAATSSNLVKPTVTPKSAWAKGPPQQQQPSAAASTVPSPSRSNTPNPNASANATPAHSRRPSAYTPAVAAKGGQPRPTSMAFGSIDATSGSTTTTTPAADAQTPAVNGVARSTANSSSSGPPAPVRFGSISSPPPPSASTPATSSAVSSAPPASTSTTTNASTAATPAPSKRKLDPNMFFQNQPQQPSASSSPSLSNQGPVVNSPQTRNVGLPPGGLAPHHSMYHSPQQPTGPAHLRPTPSTGGPGGPRSPSFQRNQPVNGVGPRTQQPGTTGPNGPTTNPGMSPRISVQATLPQMQPGVIVPQQPQQPPQVQTQPSPNFSPPMPPGPHWQQQYWAGYPPYGYMQHEQWAYSPHMQHSHLPPHQHHMQHHPTMPPHSYQMHPPPTTQPPQPIPQAGPTPPLTHQQPIQPQQPPQPSQPSPYPQPPLTLQPPTSQVPGTPISPRHLPLQPVIPPTPGTPGPATAPPLNTSSLASHSRPTIGTPLTPTSAPFVPKKSAAVRIMNPDTRETVVFRPPDTGTGGPGGSGGVGHSRSVSLGGRGAGADDNAAFSPFPPPQQNGKKVRLESPEDKAKREEEARKKKEAEAEEIKKKEEAERKRIEDAEREKREKEEEEARIKKEQEEAEERERLETIRQEEEEKERLRKEKEAEQERLRLEQERLEAEAAAAQAKVEEEARIQKEKEEEEERRRVQEAKEKEEAENLALAAAAAAKEAESSSVSTPASASPKPSTPSLGGKPTLPPIATTPDNKPRKPVPGPLDLRFTKQPGNNLPQPLPSALATARVIEDLDQVKYPEGIRTPDIELNKGITDGKFKYDRDFLLQFMSVCKDKPDHLPPLDALGIERDEAGGAAFAGPGRPHQGGRRGMMGPPSYTPAGRSMSASVGLGISIPGGKNPFGMGNFQAPSLGGRTGTSEDRFNAATRAASVAYGTGVGVAQGGRHAMTRTTSQQGVGGARVNVVAGQDGGVPQSPREATSRTRSQRGRQRNESLKPNQAGAAANAVLQQQQHAQQQAQHFQPPFEPVAPLQVSENRWTLQSRGAKASAVDDEKANVERKVKALLNKLTMEKFDSISDQIIQWANKSESETDGKTLIQVIKLVFEKATDEATWSEMYAKLCRKMMEQISPDVRDEGVTNPDGKPIAGGQLFRKYLLNRCQEDFERGWSAKEAALAAAATKKAEDDSKAAAAAASGKEDEIELYSEEYYAALKAKRQGLGLVKFIGELFKLQMLTERIMHECIKKLLSNVENPEEEEIESLCKLLTTVGHSLDTQKAKNHMDIYFTRMELLAKNPSVASRVQYMLLDVIELRSRGWKARQAVAAPSTLAAVHEQAAKEKAAAEAAAAANYNRNTMSRGGSRRGEHTRAGDYGNQPGADGWNVASGSAAGRAPPAKAGDLSNFGKITKSGGMMTMGPSSVFKKGDRGGSGAGIGLGLGLAMGAGGRENGPTSSNSLSRAASSQNMFSLLDAGEAPSATGGMSRSVSSHGPPRKPSVDTHTTASGSIATPDTPMRKRIQLLPRTVSMTQHASTAGNQAVEEAEDADGADARSEGSAATEPEAGTATAGSSVVAKQFDMTDAQAEAKIAEDVKEIFAVRNTSEAEECFVALPDQHQSKLVDAMVTYALDKKDSDVSLAADVFAKVSGSVQHKAFENGFAGNAEFLEDISIDVPQAYTRLARMLKGAGLPRDAVERLAQKIAVEDDSGTPPKEKLLSAFDALA